MYLLMSSSFLLILDTLGLHTSGAYCFICRILIYWHSVLGECNIQESNLVSLCFFQIHSEKFTPASHCGSVVWPSCSGCPGHQLWSSPGQSWSGGRLVSAQFCQDARLGHQRAHALQQDWWQTGVKYQRWEYFSAFIFLHFAFQVRLDFFKNVSLRLRRPSRHSSGLNHKLPGLPREHIPDGSALVPSGCRLGQPEPSASAQLRPSW